MTGPEHYRKAERLLELADEFQNKGALKGADTMTQRAQAHATLALAAGTVMSGSLNRLGREAWEKVAGAPTSAVPATGGATNE